MDQRETPASSFTPRRRWFRFSLRSLLILTTIVAVFFGLWGSQGRKERLAADAIRAIDGNITYDWQVRPEYNPREIWPYKPWNPTRPGPAWLRRLLGDHWFDRIAEVRLQRSSYDRNPKRLDGVADHLVILSHLRSLSLSGPVCKPSDVNHLAKLKQLRKLLLFQTSPLEREHATAIAELPLLQELSINEVLLTPEILEILAHAPRLKTLSISCNRIIPATGQYDTRYQLKDDAATAISKFKNLESLQLYGMQMTDEGMRTICHLRKLKCLVVGSRSITSQSLSEVAKLQQLEVFDIWGWQVDPSDLAQLAKLPNLIGLRIFAPLADEDLAILSELKQLVKLEVEGEKITTASLQTFYPLTNLQTLTLEETSIDPKSLAARALKKALPNCSVRLPMTAEQKETERLFRASRFSDN